MRRGLVERRHGELAMNEDWLTKAVLAIAGWLIAWGSWITARSFSGLSRTDHERLCEKRQREVDAQLKTMTDKQDQILNLLIDEIRRK